MTRPGRSPRARALALVVAATLLVAGACGGDGDDAAPTSPPEEPTTTVDGGGSADEGTSTSEADGTTTTTAPSSAGPIELREALLDAEVLSEALGEELTPDPSVGTGALEPEVCEDVELDPTWEEQASNALSTGEGTSGLIVTQAVLQAADEAAAEAIVASTVEALIACLEGLGVEPEDLADGEADPADQAVIIDRAGAGSGAGIVDAVALVRVGARVTVLTVVGPSATAAPIDGELLGAAAEVLGG